MNAKKTQKKLSERTVVLRDNALNIFTDGSCLPHLRRGGIGIRFVTTDTAGDEVIEDYCLPGYKGSTNNQMEMMACIKALEIACDHPMLDVVNEVWLYTDSMYVTNNMPNAMFGWQKLKWMNRSGRPIENTELWKELIRVVKRVPRRIRFQWVKGHSKNAHNKVVDKLAKQSARGILNKNLRVTTVRRKKTDRPAHVGSVKMEGQTMTVRIVTDTYSRTHKLYKYMYEVLTESSPYCGNCDYIYSELMLRAGHHYEVRVNETPDNQRIVEVLNERDRVTGAVLTVGEE